MSNQMRRHPRARRPWPPAIRAATLAVIGTLLVVPQVLGQAQPPSSGTPQTGRPQTGAQQGGRPQAATPQNVSDQKLKATATAITKVEGIRENYQQQLAQAPEGDRDRIVDQADNEMLKAISDQGLSVDEYNSILQQAQTDPKLKDRLIQQLPQHGQQAPGP